MAISAYVGLPGHGKSYGVVENIIVPGLKNKRVIFTNIPMKSEEVFKRFGINVVQFEVEDIVSNPNWWNDVFVSGSIFVLDEVPKLWPAGMKANNMRESDRAFLSEHRHLVGEDGYSTEIVLVVQKLNMIASFCRSLIENTFWVVKHTKLGMNKNYRVDVYFGAMDGNTPQITKREREIQGRFKKSTYELYHSHTKSMTGQAGNESRVDSRFNIFKGASIKFGFLLFIMAIFFVYYGFGHLKSGFGLSEEEVKEVPVASVPVASVPVKSGLVKVGNSSPVSKKKKASSFVQALDSISISHTMVIYNKGKKRTERYFKVVKGKTEAVISDLELKLLGYSFKVISDCVYLIESDSYSDFVMCGSKDEPKGFFEDLTNTSPSA